MNAGKCFFVRAEQYPAFVGIEFVIVDVFDRAICQFIQIQEGLYRKSRFVAVFHDLASISFKQGVMFSVIRGT